VVVGGTIGGVALAQTGTGDDNQPEAKYGVLLDKVCKIYQEKTGVAIDQAALQDAFTQSQSEMQNEALDNYLKNLVDQGKITQEQADQYKAWLKARPDMAQYRQQLKDWQQTRPGIPPELNEWEQARPDIPLPEHFGGHGGMKGGGGCFFGSW
jgi:polyhydroxyalkanoate synthesis regulator phasin